jgi:hypothetical protein
MNMECSNLSKLLEEGKWGKAENNGGDEPNQGTLYLYIKVSQQNPCITII